MTDLNGQHKVFTFSEFRLETESQTLWRDSQEIHLAKRPLNVLIFLIENRERVISRNELLDKFWDGHDVYDDALRKCVGRIRHSLNDTGKSPRFIETRWGSGYRFVGTVEVESRESRVERKSESQSSHFKFQNDESQTKDKEQRTNDKIKNRAVLFAVLIIGFIVLAVLGFYNFRQPSGVTPENSTSLTQAVAEKHSIAVMPLKNLTGDAANDYLSDGVTESLINELSQIKELRVISRGSAFQFKGKDIDVREIGEKLHVETILEGSLLQIGDKLRVNARLVNSKDGSVLWASDSQDRKLADIFAIQNGIVCQLVTELKVKLCGEIAPSERYTKNVKAYQFYLQGLYYRTKHTTVKRSLLKLSCETTTKTNS